MCLVSIAATGGVSVSSAPVHVNYGVATASRIDQIIGLFCRIASLLQDSFAKETYNLIDPTNRSHPIVNVTYVKYSHVAHMDEAGMSRTLSKHMQHQEFLVSIAATGGVCVSMAIALMDEFITHIFKKKKPASYVGDGSVMPHIFTNDVE